MGLQDDIPTSGLSSLKDSLMAPQRRGRRGNEKDDQLWDASLLPSSQNVFHFQDDLLQSLTMNLLLFPTPPPHSPQPKEEILMDFWTLWY